ncbi:nuclear receptor coactivator 7 isoform X1 [Colossoma macropomum]|uniref:nuclear receptor coactivator 7 isoform X1 n=1 Tax=Colossoma macropomum TaxID=42526 RepID=UPI0018653B55|nr:nuclear receptor coactivator 7 isoform X1 [Colossoma macropomum]
MEKKEKRPGYFARLKKRRQLKQSQSEKAVTEENHSDPESKGPIICAPAPTEQLQEKNLEGEKCSKTERTLSEGSESECKSNGQAKKEKRKPPGTIEYTVGPNDTLNGIALKFNITPNKLVQLNRLFSRSVVPGQKLFVPDVGQSETGSSDNTSSDSVNKTASQKDLQNGKSSCRSGTQRHRELSPPSEDESPATVKFLKMSCKYFTDGMGVVGGVMIVTPNNIMFDPHKSDPLVIEHGCEEYGLICPMEEVLSVALYDDVSRMKLKDALPSDMPQEMCPLYRPGEWVELPSEHDLNPFSRYEALGQPNRPIVLDDIETTVSETAECHPADKSPSDEGFTELELVQNDSGTENGSAEMSHNKQKTANITCLSLEGASLQEVSDSEEAKVVIWPPSDETVKAVRSCDKDQEEEEEEDEGLHNRSTDENVETDGNKPSTLHGGTELNENGHIITTSDEVKDTKKTGMQIPTLESSQMEVAAGDHMGLVSPGNIAEENCSSSGPRHEEDKETIKGPNSEQELSEREKERQTNEAEMKSWLLKRMQGPIEDMLLSTEEKSKNPPMFLCFRVGKPMRKSFAVGRTSSPAHPFGGRGKQPEYWFAVPQERVDHLYSFFIQWSPDAYGKDAQEQGFVVVEKDELNMIDNFFSDPVPRSWEIITINEAKRRQSFGSFEDEEPLDLLPILMDPSTLLEDTHIEKLAARLPARVQGYPWRLAYSTVVHGTSLKTLYRNLGEVDCPVLLVIKDMDNQVFGAFSTHPFRVSEHYYGTGETFLYTFSPEIKMFCWTGENSYFVKGNLDSLQIGGGGGHLGLWLDADLYHGTTSKCSTFNNQPLSSQQDFTIQNLEVWAFE